MLGRTTRPDGRQFGAKCERVTAIGCEGPDDFKKGGTGMRQGRALAMNQPEPARNFQFRNRDLDQLSAGQLGLNRQSGHQRHPIATRDKSLDGLQAGQLHPHVQRGMVTSEGLNHALAQGGGHGVRDEILGPQFTNGNLLSFGQRMPGDPPQT